VKIKLWIERPTVDNSTVRWLAGIAGQRTISRPLEDPHRAGAAGTAESRTPYLGSVSIAVNSAVTEVLTESEWRAREHAHRQRVLAWTDPHRRRQAAGEHHPVLDFLSTYYSERPSRLERWSPGAGVALAGPAAKRFLRRSGFTRTEHGVALDLAHLTRKRRHSLEFVHSLLSATASRPPRLNCFGLHEWAMVYRQSAEEIRHASWPLRLGERGTDEVVESLPVRCGHFDAFRFFTPAARPLNTLRPRRADQVALEQPGCLHTNMDLYRWCYKLSPMVPSELVADCFGLAVELRELDMCASPYDLSTLGYRPVPIETAEGRAEYARRQAELAARAATLRERLIAVCAELAAFTRRYADAP
jgi:hypothetical protein